MKSSCVADNLVSASAPSGKASHNINFERSWTVALFTYGRTAFASVSSDQVFSSARLLSAKVAVNFAFIWNKLFSSTECLVTQLMSARQDNSQRLESSVSTNPGNRDNGVQVFFRHNSVNTLSEAAHCIKIGFARRTQNFVGNSVFPACEFLNLISRSAHFPTLRLVVPVTAVFRAFELFNADLAADRNDWRSSNGVLHLFIRLFKNASLRASEITLTRCEVL